MAPTTRQTTKRLRGDAEPAAPSAQEPEPQGSQPKRRSLRTKAPPAAPPVAPSPSETPRKTTAKATGKKPASTRASKKVTAPKKKATAKVTTKRVGAKKTPVKKTKKTLACVGAGVDVFLTPSLLDSILNFVPAPNMRWKRGGCATAFMKTIASVCRVLPSAYAPESIVERYGPANQHFWRTKLFQYFDFTVAPNKSLNFRDYTAVDVSHGPWVRRDKAEAAKRRRRHFRRQEDDYYSGYSDEEGGEDLFLEEDFQLWTKLYIYHRRSHYSFLTDIQAGTRQMSSFPDTIDAYELFQDLAIAVDEMRRFVLVTNSSTNKRCVETNIHPCLLRRMPKKVTPRGSDLLDVCGWSPEFWDCEYRMVSMPWEGLSASALQAIARAKYSADADATELVLPEVNIHERDERNPLFLCWGDEERPKVEKFIQKRLCDWRRVRLGSMVGPQFFIGKRGKTNRWMGFISSSPETW